MDENESITKGLRFMSEDLVSIADRIDAEMVELPKGADGKPLHLGDTVYDQEGLEHEIAKISFAEGSDHTIKEPQIISRDACNFIYPRSFTHERPDSLERIADDLDAWCDRTDVDGNACGEPRELAERIRRLAEREASNGTD